MHRAVSKVVPLAYKLSSPGDQCFHSLFHISAQWEGEGAKTAQQGTFMDPQ